MASKSILMSIQPQWVAKILNGEKTIEVRKKFPKNYVGWVYIYCTKTKPNAHIWTMKVKEKPYKVIFSKTQYQQETDLDEFMNVEFIEKYPQYAGERIICHPEHINGYVVARFWCDKVEHFEFETISRDIDGYWFDNGDMVDKKLLKQSCLTYDEFYDYIKFGEGYAIHITRLEIFDEPMLITMFRKVGFRKFLNNDKPNRMSLLETLKKYSITKAPQSWQYIE